MYNTYGEYQNLNLATTACSNDTECMGIYLSSCDENEQFLLFKDSFVTSIYSKNCIYKKKTYGKFCFYINNSRYYQIQIASLHWMISYHYTIKAYQEMASDALTCLFISPLQAMSGLLDIVQHRPNGLDLEHTQISAVYRKVSMS